MKVTFFTVAMLAALGLVDLSEAVPVRNMSQADADLDQTFTLGEGETKVVDLTGGLSATKPAATGKTGAAKNTTGATNAISSLMNQTNGLTAALMDKMTKTLNSGESAESGASKLETGFEISLDNFEVSGLFEDKPAPTPAPKKVEEKPMTVTVSKGDATTTEKKADKADAIKKLEAAKK